MDRLNQLRAGAEAGAGRGGDATLDTSSPPSEAYMSANESSSKYFSLSDSTFDISPMKDVSLASAASTTETDHTMTDPDELLSNLSPITKKDVMLDSFKMDKQIEAANILSGGVDIFDDNENSFDGDELVIDDNVDMDDKSSLEKESQLDELVPDATLEDTTVDVASKDTEVVLQIDGKNVDAIDIGNGLYLYRKAGQEELAAVQIITEENQQAPSFKFLKVRENAEGNLEVYEEFEIEVSKDVPINEAKPSAKNTPHVPFKDIKKVISESTRTKVDQNKDQMPPKEVLSSSPTKVETEVKESESKTELNLNGKMMKFSECRKSPVVGSFTPMTYHSTPNKEGKPLTKTMVDLQLHPSRHSDNVKKTIEVHTDSQTKKLTFDEIKHTSESPAKKNVMDNITKEISATEKETTVERNKQSQNQDPKDLRNENTDVSCISNEDKSLNEELKNTDQKSNKNKDKMKVDDIAKNKEDTVDPIKVLNDNKTQEPVTLPKTVEVEMKDPDSKKQDMVVSKQKDSIFPTSKTHDIVTADVVVPKSKESIVSTDKTHDLVTLDVIVPKPKDSTVSTDKTHDLVTLDVVVPKPVDSIVFAEKTHDLVGLDMVIPKPKDSNVSADKSHDLVSKNLIYASLLGPTRVNQILRSNTGKIVGPSASNTVLDKVNEETEKVSTKNDIKSTSIVEVNKDVLGTKSNMNKLDQVLGTQKIKEVMKSETKTEETIKPNQVSKTTEPNTELKPENINSTVQEITPNVSELKSKIASQTVKSNQVESKIDDRAVSISKSVEIKTTSEIDKSKLIAKSIEPITVSEQDKLNRIAKPIDQTTAPKIEKTNPVTKIETPITSSADKTNVLEKKVEPKTILLSNKLIPIAKGIDVSTVSKSGALNPTEKKIERKPLSQTEKLISITKANEPKTYTKTEQLNPTSKAIEPKVVPKIYHLNPVTKGMELKTVSKTVILNPVPKGIEPKILKIDKVNPIPQQIPKNKAVIITSNKILVPSKVDSLTNKEINILQAASNSEAKPLNNNHTAVPFGQWTDANRQEFVNKFKEIKVPPTSNSKQIKNSNDLNRIDVLKKIDSQRSNTAKTQDKLNIKDTVFSSKIPSQADSKIPVKNEGLKVKPKPIDNKNNTKLEGGPSETVSSTVTSNVSDSDVAVPETEERREVNVNDLIGKAIVDMLNRPVPMPMTRSPLDEPRPVDRDAHITQTVASTEAQNPNIDQQKLKTDELKQNIDTQKLKIDQQKLNIDQLKLKTDQRKLNTDQQKLNIEQKIDEDSSGSLDYIEMKMNELHGIPFVERPPHELPKVHKTYSKSGKDKNQSKGEKKLLPATSKQNLVQDNNVIDLESDEEVIEHEPITGDIDLSKIPATNLPAPVKTHVSDHKTVPKETRKDPVITENEFDKFARRNSITYEDCLTVKFDGNESANLVQTVKEKDAIKVFPRNDTVRMDAKTKLPQKQTISQIQASRYPNTKFGTVPEDPNNKNYQSKIHTAYQSALTAKLQMDRPIAIIEDKPVKVVFMDTNSEFVPNQLNVQGKELSPAKKTTVESAQVSPKSANSDVTDSVDDKQQDDTKIKTKHQRKQVLNPVEAPELELIQPRDLGLDVSPKKKRKTDDNKTEKTLKNLVHKKSYLLGRTVADEKRVTQEVTNPVKEPIISAEIVTDRTVSAIDNLVKAAELLENQSVQSASPNSDSQQNTPLKRGRGRPRKYPLPEGVNDSKIASPSPQKKPRLIDAKPVKPDPASDVESSDEEQIIRENWTMGKINENIVCPICNKLFRSENVVFKHVKHCTGLSPTRSDLEKRSPRRRRHSSDKSFESESDMDLHEKPKENIKITPKKCKSKESTIKNDVVDIITIEDTPVKEPVSKAIEEKTENPEISEEQPSKAADHKKEKPKKMPEERSVREPTLKELADEKHKSKKLEEDSEGKSAKMKKLAKTEEQRSSCLVCEFCGKTFRQASYLANHKQQHKKEQLQKLEAKLTAKIQVFSCEVCKKKFRKLHHLVQHRIIHNPEVPTRTTRKSSSEQSDTKVKEPPAPKQNDDTSAGFRCEPCDKSFRKLHHLVEHRETHDGKNRQKTNVQTAVPPAPPQTLEKPPLPPQCDVCKKTFRKLHHLIEHKEQHHVEQVETSSEKSDDKSVQSSLSTRDIIHECSLCYMVFPNEHSLNKHFVICQQKKKRQSKAKDKPKNDDVTDVVEESTNTENSMDGEDAPKIISENIIDDDEEESIQESKSVDLAEIVEKKRVSEKPADTEKKDVTKSLDVSEIPVPKEEVIELKSAPAKRDLPKSDDSTDVKMVVPEKIKKIDDLVKVELPKKDKVPPTVTKRQKSIAPLPDLPKDKPTESNDDDEVRYMLNPNFKVDDAPEGKVFMKVRSNKRNSLQIERPISRDLLNRRTSLQQPPKIPRLKAKAVEPKIVPTVTKNIPKTSKSEAAATDSDDSDVKYAFPDTVTAQIELKETSKEKKAPIKSLVEKRKSLSGIAKRKSLGQAIAKSKVNPAPVRIIKRRTLDVEHRCDCGQLFNSAALLTRHTSLAHTPPRIRRRRSPPPDASNPPRKSTDQPAKTTRKSSVKNEASNSKPTRKSSVKSDTPETRKSIKPELSQGKKSSAKPKRNATHSGVPIPCKNKKLMLKNAK